MSKRTNLIMISLALILALFTTILVVRRISSVATKPVAANGPLTSVVVVAEPLTTNHVIESTDVSVEQVLSKDVAPGAFTSTTDVVGQFAKTDWFSGQQVVPGMVESAKAATFAMSIPVGKVAFTLTDSPLWGNDYLISKGDKVDVEVTYNRGGKTISEIFLQDVLVLYVDTASADANPANGAKTSASGADTITLALSPGSAKKLAYILGTNNTAAQDPVVRMMLRHP